jgi:ketosteroid isomerase-like protein
MNRGESAFDEALDLCDPEMEMRAPGRLPDTDTAIRGGEALKAWATGLWGTFDIRLEPDEFIDAGDSVVVVFRQIARGRASGAELTIHLAFVFGLRGGKLVSADGYRTNEEALEAVGQRE